ncbi:TonB-dependent receptor [Microbulbifer sp. SH-1]|uniref:TonB-dependent receptor plug domain-containing protein n=1 Tax=Microbulbifer sp. SH-1 TaxID=2681547 RepID=UPI00140E80B8|nr:TonB-dependent receptor [Microbulbifer sp. SH-1]QIL91253.1 TonB-dependent receptor [Microbulbifer sp. SH-1]
MINSKRRVLYTAMMMLIAAKSVAQSEQAENGAFDAQQTDLEEVTVTGTLIRGIAPTGANVVSLDLEGIEATGAMSASEALASIPQVSSNFNNVRALTGGGALNLAPSLRNFGPSAAATTLVVMDGRRLINAGLLATSPDPDVIPPSMLERVEVLTDGGSSIYGSDAVGGVINFITRKNFDGVEISANYGVESSYDQVDLNLSAGHDWGSGSAFVSYTYAGNEAIYGRDKDFMQQVTVNGGQCGSGTVFSGSTPHALPNLEPGTITDCDVTDDATFYPEVTRHSVFAGFSQDISENINFDLKAFYSDRESISWADPESDDAGGGGQTVVICSPALGATCSALGGVVFPGYTPVAGDVGFQTVKFNYAGLIDDRETNNMEAFQVLPSLTFSLANGWRLQAQASYGESSTESFNQLVNGAGQRAVIASGALNPYDPRSTDPNAVVGAFGNFIGSGTQEMTNVRFVADGDWFETGAGAVGVAFGAEYTAQGLSDIIYGEFPATTGAAGANTTSADRDIESVFAEFVVPVVSGQNAVTGIQELTLSVSGRYDNYSDFGDTTNPKVGFTYVPVDSVTIRGNWGKSFVAPSLADTHAPDTRSQSLPAFLALNPAVPPASMAQNLITLLGGNPDLDPQKAETWSLGAEIDLPFVPGLTLSASYYDIHFEDQISLNTSFYTDATAPYWVMNPSQEEVEAAVAGAPYIGVPIETLYTPGFGNGVYAILDFRRNNLAEVKQNGVDFNASYLTDVASGSLLATLGGTYTLHREVMSGPGQEFVDVLEAPGESELALQASLSWQLDNFTAKATWNHTSGYELDPVVTTARFGEQGKVGSFDTMDLFFKYNLESQGALENTSLTFNVKNVLDEEPPFFSGTELGSLPGFTNGSTLGRLAILGINKKF